MTSDPASAGASVLLVDDRPANLVALDAALRAFVDEMGARLLHASGADEALRHVLAEGDRLAVILLDVQMPGVDGLETARRIRQRERSRHVPIIFVTAHTADTHAVEEGYAAGAVDYLFKPLSPEIVRAKVRTFIELSQYRQASREAAATVAAAEARRLASELALREDAALVETVRRIGGALASDLNLERLVQTITDETTSLTGAQFGAFFYTTANPQGEGEMLLYTLSGVSREHFSHFPHPRATPVFGPTFRGEGVVRSDDITVDPRYGQMAPHHGMPAGHLPVKSYLAVPVRSGSGEVLGGLFFGHARAAVFSEREERLVVGIAGWAAVAMDNARLYAAEHAARTDAEAANEQLATQALELELTNQQLQDNAVELEAQTEELQASAAHLEEQTAEAVAARAKVESVLESTADSYFVLDAHFRIIAVNGAMMRATGLGRDELVGHEFWTCFPGTIDTEFERIYRKAATERVADHFIHDYSDGRLDLVVDVDVYPAEGGGIVVFWRDVTLRERAARALRTSEGQLRAFADAIPTLAWVAGPDGYITWYNARWFEYTGTTPAEMEGWGWQSVHDPAVLPDVLREWTGAIAAGNRFEMTFPLRGADGSYRRFLTRVVPVRDDDGHVIRWFGTNTDVEAELAARDLAIESGARTERLQRLTSALASVTTVDQAALVIVDDSARLTGASSAGICLLVPGTNGTEIVRHRGIHAGVAEKYARMSLDVPGPAATCMRSGEPVFVESRDGPEGFSARFPGVLEDLERQGMHAIASVPLILGTEVTGAISFAFSRPRTFSASERAFFTELAAQATQALERARLLEAEHRARAEAETAELRLRDIFEQAPVAVAVLTGPELVYTIVSPQYSVTPGAGRTLLGRSVRDVFPEAEYAPLIATMERVFHTGEPYHASERRVFLDPRHDGSLEPHYFNVGYQPLCDAAGQVYAIASVTNDVTEQVLARQQVEGAREEAERLRIVAEDANAAKSQLLSSMSHELRTPLNATLGYVDLLELGIRGPLTDTQRADLQRIRLANQHLLSLINDILNFARLEAGRLEYHPERLLLDSVVAELEPLVAPLLSAKGIAFEHDSCSTDTPGAPHGILADRERVRQVLLNLITNAVKFTETGGRVTITCVDDVVAPVVHIIVSDTGRGIPAADLARIFEPFVQIDRHATHASQQGVGLGLAISRELARGMNGDLTVTSEVGRGSAFTLTLPRATLET